MKSQVTTKRGDSGTTVTLGGETLSKGHPAIECVGTLDELRTNTAYVRLLIIEAEFAESGRLAEFLKWILETYFVIGATCSDASSSKVHKCVEAADLDKLELAQSFLEERVELPKAFSVSAQGKVAAQIDILCTIVRRFERRLVAYKETAPELDTETLLPFVNRLSDYFYMLARYVDAETGGANRT